METSTVSDTHVTDQIYQDRLAQPVSWKEIENLSVITVWVSSSHPMWLSLKRLQTIQNTTKYALNSSKSISQKVETHELCDIR
eukprot:758153-Hanusia_phi.AAC.5